MHNALDIGSGPAVRCLNVHSYSCIQLYSRTVHDRRVYDRSASTAVRVRYEGHGEKGSLFIWAFLSWHFSYGICSWLRAVARNC
jgi:hypothetical protein